MLLKVYLSVFCTDHVISILQVVHIKNRLVHAVKTLFQFLRHEPFRLCAITSSTSRGVDSGVALGVSLISDTLSLVSHYIACLTG
jgi:hypothetical protein